MSRKIVFLASLMVSIAGPQATAQVPTLKEKLFADPTNIEINLAYLQQQLAGGNFKGAAATLQRVLLLDPNSKLAKVLYAEVQLRLGNRADTRLILRELLADKSLSEEMRARAQALSDALERSEKRLRLSGSIGVAGGSADNALAAPKGPKIQFFDELNYSSGQEVTEAFVDFDSAISAAYKLPTYRERSVTGSFGVAGRDYVDFNTADSRTSFAAFGFSEKRKLPWSANANTYVTEVSGHNYNAGYQLGVSVSANLPNQASIGATLRGGETRHFTYLGSSAGKLRDNDVYGVTFDYAQPIAAFALPLLLSARLGADESNAKVDYHSTRSVSTMVTARSRIKAVNISLSADFLETDFDAADPLIGSTIRTDERSRLSFSLTYQLSDRFAGVGLNVSGFFADTRSNIPNFTKTLSELKFGLRKSF